MKAVLHPECVELLEVALPLVRPFRTSRGERAVKEAVLVRVRGEGVEGWGECPVDVEPRFSDEWLAGAWEVLEHFLVPSLLQAGPISDPGEVRSRIDWVKGHPRAKAALEAAVLDAWLRIRDESLSSFLGVDRERVPCGVSVGIASNIDALIEEILGYVARGYQRVKLKIEPGRDVEAARAVREALPDTPLSVDANGAYGLDDFSVFQELEGLELVMIEQPLSQDDLLGHARLQATLRTPICLDESIRHAKDAATAIELGSCRIINIKPARVGGLLEAKRVYDVALLAGVPVWVGGMLETGVGRAANLAMAGLPAVSLPGDTSASDRYFERDITEPFILDSDGTIAVPKGPGIGVAPLAARLAEAVVHRVEIR